MSAVVALANPRRIKASHRRRRKVASDHLLYILNNPLSGTDPTGYLIGCGPNYSGCGGGGILGEFHGGGSGNSGGSSCKGLICNVALGGNGNNGAKKGDSATPEKRNESNSGLSGKIADIGNSIKNGLFGPIIEYGERGKPGSFGDHALNGAKWLGNTAIDGFSLSPAGQVVEKIGDLPRFEYGDKGLATPAVLQVAFLAAGAAESGSSLAGKMRGVGKSAGEAAEAGAPGMRQPASGSGAQDVANRGTSGASGDLTTASGNRYTGNSTGSSASGGAPRAPMHPKVQEALDSVQNPSRSHGHCCEIDSANKAFNAGDNVRGAKMGPVRLNESGRILPACSTCREVKKYLGIE